MRALLLLLVCFACIVRSDNPNAPAEAEAIFDDQQFFDYWYIWNMYVQQVTGYQQQLDSANQTIEYVEPLLAQTETDAADAEQATKDELVRVLDQFSSIGNRTVRLRYVNKFVARMRIASLVMVNKIASNKVKKV